MAIYESTYDKMVEMKLSTMARTYRDLADNSETNSLNFDERLAMLIDAEYDMRRVNRRMRLLRQADFCFPDASVTDVRYDPDRNLNKDRITTLSACTWIDEHRNVVITGATGAGKSWIACALGVAACNSFYSVRYIRMPHLLDLLCVKKDEDWMKMRKRYITCDVLIIDDWMLEPLNVKQARELLEIIESRNGEGSMILCSQFSAGGWAEKIGEGALGEAIIDRIVHNAYGIHIDGDESMRKRLSTLE